MSVASFNSDPDFTPMYAYVHLHTHAHVHVYTTAFSYKTKCFCHFMSAGQWQAAFSWALSVNPDEEYTDSFQMLSVHTA